MTDVTVFHNQSCSTSRHALDEAAVTGVAVDVVQYLKRPLDREALLALMARLEDSPADLVRKDPFFKSLGLAVEDLASAHHIYSKALAGNTGTWIDFGGSRHL